MKTKEKKKTEKTLLIDLREIRDKLSMEMKDMTLAQIKIFLDAKKTLHPSPFWK